MAFRLSAPMAFAAAAIAALPSWAAAGTDSAASSATRPAVFLVIASIPLTKLGGIRRRASLRADRGFINDKGSDRLILGPPREATPEGPGRVRPRAAAPWCRNRGDTSYAGVEVCCSGSVHHRVPGRTGRGAGGTSPEGLVDRHLGHQSQPGERPPA